MRIRSVALAAFTILTFAIPARAAFVVNYFGPASWGAPDATIGVSGFTIENFEDTALAPGLMISRFGGVVGNFGPTATLPASSVFDPTTDPNTAAGGLQAFVSGVWDGSNVLINHPGPSFSDSPGT